jgi:hypothetical protein
MGGTAKLELVMSRYKDIEMQRFLVLSFITMSACVPTGPVEVVYKPGSTREQRMDVTTNCATLALARVPRAMASSVTPSYSTPSNVQCYSTGNYTNCQETGGQTFGGNAYTFDANQELRDRVVMQCMRENGYTLISRPTCDAEQSKRAISSSGRGQPTADKIECVVDGGFVMKP